MNKNLKALLLFVLTAILLCSCGIAEQKTGKEGNEEFKVTVLKIGQADAIILKSSQHIAVIDCGEQDDGREIAEYLSDCGVKEIDYMFITHFDKDHIGGAAEVMENVAVGQIITPDYEGSGKEYETFIEAVKEHGYTLLKLTEEMSLEFDDVACVIYPPLKTSYSESDNDFSLAISITHGENRFLFTGDAEKERLEEILLQAEGKYDFLKVPHHGLYEKNTEKFIESINPEYAVITCSDKNPADQYVLQILEKYGSKTYLTSKGNVEVTSDGKNIKIFQ
ncbi:MAG: MBL fold metallo-hydrolase [Firmicutes bacterium]|nr:MBL fold metallo-hydrolase [Bacillota bacterium]